VIPGDVLLMLDAHAGDHCWVVLHAIDGGAKVVAVMLRTARAFTDKTVILKAGDHPFVSVDTCIDYSSAKPFVVSGLRQRVTDRLAFPKQAMDAVVLQRILEGLCLSSRTPNYIKDEAGCGS